MRDVATMIQKIKFEESSKCSSALIRKYNIELDEKYKKKIIKTLIEMYEYELSQDTNYTPEFRSNIYDGFRTDEVLQFDPRFKILNDAILEVIK